MTKRQFNKKYKDQVKEIMRLVLRRGDELFGSGAIDTADYADNYTLPKIIASVACEQIAKNVLPIDPKHKEVAENLRNF